MAAEESDNLEKYANSQSSLAIVRDQAIQDAVNSAVFVSTSLPISDHSEASVRPNSDNITSLIPTSYDGSFTHPKTYQKNDVTTNDASKSPTTNKIDRMLNKILNSSKDKLDISNSGSDSSSTNQLVGNELKENVLENLEHSALPPSEMKSGINQPPVLDAEISSISARIRQRINSQIDS